MADRGLHGLAYKAQSVAGTAATPPYKLLPLATFEPGISFNRVADPTGVGSRLSQPGRAGTVPVAPSFTVPMRPLAFDPFLESLFMNAWATDVLTQASTRKLITLEDRQSDAAFATIYEDIMVNSLTLNFQPNALVESTWNLIGNEITTGSTLSASPTAADDEDPFDTWTGAFSYAGTSAFLTSLSLTITCNHEPRYALGSRSPNRTVTNLDGVTGSMTLALENKNRLDDAINNTSRALAFSMSVGGKSHAWSLGAVKTTSWGAPVTTDAERLQTIGFEADINGGTKVSLTRDNT